MILALIALALKPFVLRTFGGGSFWFRDFVAFIYFARSTCFWSPRKLSAQLWLLQLSKYAKFSGFLTSFRGLRACHICWLVRYFGL